MQSDLVNPGPRRGRVNRPFLFALTHGKLSVRHSQSILWQVNSFRGKEKLHFS